MPVYKRHARSELSADAQSLIRRLVEEWRNPNERLQQPAIIEDQAPRGGPLHVYVVWDEWSGFDQIDRSEIIMDAYEQVYGLDASLKVTAAMGLTPQEAERMGIRYE